MSWIPLTVASGNGGLTTLLDEEASDPNRFYRLRVQVAPPILTPARAYPAGLTFSFSSVATANVTYVLDYTTNLVPPVHWTTVASEPGYPVITSLADRTAADKQRFYRVRVE